jgi:hypothetical protein
MADQALDNAKDATDTITAQATRTTDQLTDVAREATHRAEDVARHGFQVIERTADAVSEVQREVAHRSAEGAAELGRVLVDLTVAQTRQNVETLKALTEAVDWDEVARAVDWDRVFQLQSEFLRISLERTAQLTQRYLEVTQTVVTSAASSAQREAKKAA